MFAFLRRRSLEADFAALDNNLGTINTRLDDLEMKIEAAANTGCKCVIA